jgi:MFS family permease
MIELTKRTRVVIALGSAQTLAWGSSYYLPAILAAPMARELGVSTGLVFGAFSAALIVAAVLGPLAGRRIDLFGGRDVLVGSSSASAWRWGSTRRRSPLSPASTVERRAAQSPASRCWQV